MNKKERLEALIAKYSDGKPTRFAKYIGVAPSTISTWLARDSFDYDLLFAKCKDLSAQWLLTGEGEMLKTKHASNALPSPDDSVSEDKVTKIAPSDQAKSAEKLPKGSHEGIPLIPLSAVAGFPAIDEPGVFMESCERYRIPEFEAKGAQFLIRVSGDSMMPTYQNGDIIACRKLSDILFFQWGNIYVIDSSQGQLVKQVFECQDSTDHIRCVSDNTKYPPFNLPTTDIRSLSIIVGLLRIV